MTIKDRIERKVWVVAGAMAVCSVVPLVLKGWWYAVALVGVTLAVYAAMKLIEWDIRRQGF